LTFSEHFQANFQVKKRVPTWVWGMAIILVPSLFFMVLAKVVQHRETLHPEPGDRAFVVTAAELPGAPPIDPEREVLERTVETDASLRLTYRYPREVMPDEPVSLECLVVRTVDAAAAQRALGLVGDEVKKALSVRPELLTWGDESRAGDVLKEGRVVGTYVAARKGRFVFVLRVTGLTLDAPAISRVVVPKLELLSGFGR
jgi:hypothetical protein